MAGPGVLVLFCIFGLLVADDGSLGVAIGPGPGVDSDASEDAAVDSASLILSVAKAFKFSHVGRKIAPLAITILGLTRKVRSKYHDTATNAFCDWPLATEELQKSCRF